MSEFINTADVIGDDEMCDQILMGTVTEYKENRIAKVGQYAFYGCNALAEVDVPNVTSIEQYAFCNCASLTTARFPRATSVESYAFQGCFNLQIADIGFCSTRLPQALFSGCNSLVAVVMRADTIVPFGWGGNDWATTFRYCYHFLGTVSSTYNPDGLADGYFYVPRARVEEYKADDSWSSFANQFRALEDYTVDGTITGELDETKIAA